MSNFFTKFKENEQLIHTYILTDFDPQFKRYKPMSRFRIYTNAPLKCHLLCEKESNRNVL